MSIQLRTLGSLDLRAPDGHEIRSLLAQPKRFALLAYLATSPAGFHRRDTLLALFWPESDEDAARASLRTALSVLRRSLGEGVVVTRGSDEVGVDPQRLWCDVAAFEQALAAGAWELALELYRGDLLPGFHLDDAPEFDHWLDSRRTGLRVGAAAAAWRLAEQADADAEMETAVRWAREAVALASNDEGALRRLIVMLDRLGDRAGAVQAYDAFAGRLRAEFDVEPAPETQALLRAVSARASVAGSPAHEGPAQEADASGRSPAPPFPAPHPVGAGLDADAHPVPLPAPEQARHGRTPSAPRLVVVGAVLILAIALTSLVFAPAPEPTPISQRVAVLPFENRTGDPALDPLGTMAADWISQGLMRTGLLEVVPITSVLFAVQGVPASNGRDSLEPGRELARQSGATILVSGAYYQAGDSLQFQTRISDARSGALLAGVDPVTGGGAEPLAVVEALRSRVTGSLAARLDRRLERVQSYASPPPNWEAYHASILGIEAFIELRYADARTHFRRAVELDSTYAPAPIFAAVNHINVGEWAPADSLARALISRRPRLAPHDQHLVDWLSAYIRGDRIAALRAVRQATITMPTSEWLFVVGLSALQANHPGETVATFARPEAQRGWAGQWVPYWDTLAEAHHVRGEYAEELQVAQRARQLHPQSVIVARAEIRALAALGRIADAEGILDAAMHMPPEAGLTAAGLAIRAAQELRRHGHEPAAHVAVERALAWYASRSAGERLAPAYRLGLATALYEARRWDEAGALLERLVSEYPENVGYRGLQAVVAVHAGDESTAEVAARWLEQLDPPFERWMPLLWRARIAAANGDRQHGLALLTHAFATGLWHGARWHSDTGLQPLRSDPAFHRLMRPKG